MKILIAPKDEIFLGHVGENYSTQLEFDITEWWNDPHIGNTGKVSIILRQNSLSFPVPDNDITVLNGIVTWNVGEMALTVAGRGKLELVYKVGEKIAKSRVWTTLTLNPIDLTIDNPPQIVVESLPEIYTQLDKYLEVLTTGWNGSIGFVTEEGEIQFSIINGFVNLDGAPYTGDLIFHYTAGANLLLKCIYGVICDSSEVVYSGIFKLDGVSRWIIIERGLITNVTTINPNLDGNVKYNEEQVLSGEQKTIAKKNIGVIDLKDIIIDCRGEDFSSSIFPTDLGRKIYKAIETTGIFIPINAFMEMAYRVVYMRPASEVFEPSDLVFSLIYVNDSGLLQDSHDTEGRQIVYTVNPSGIVTRYQLA